MIRGRNFFLLIFAPAIAFADQPCIDRLADESDLDEAFDKASFVFVATVIGENEQGLAVTYQLHPPALKGSVPSSGEITQANQCRGIPFLDGSAIILLFMDSLGAPLSRNNWQLVSLAEEGPGLTWVSDWLAVKMAETDID